MTQQRSYTGRVYARMPQRNDKPVFTVVVKAGGRWDAFGKIDKAARERGLDRPYIEMTGGQLS